MYYSYLHLFFYTSGLHLDLDVMRKNVVIVIKNLNFGNLAPLKSKLVLYINWASVYKETVSLTVYGLYSQRKYFYRFIG